MTQVPWRDEGATGRGLAAIAAGYGFFYDAHRAIDDCLAAIEILGRPLPRSGGPALARLLRGAAAVTHRVWALHSPYEARDVLRGRGYRWSNGTDGQLRAWYRDLADDAVEREVRFLVDQILGPDAEVPVSLVTAYERFSSRV
jgi:DNA polymerase-3 subunit epsilon